MCYDVAVKLTSDLQNLSYFVEISLIILLKNYRKTATHTIKEIWIMDPHVHVKRREADEVLVALLTCVALLAFCLSSVSSQVLS